MTLLPYMFYHINTPKYNPQQYVYTNGSFVLPEEYNIENFADSGVYGLNNDIRIIERLPGLPSTLHMELYTLFIAIAATKDYWQDNVVFTDNLNNMYLINNHIHHPSPQHNHLDKLLILGIAHRIL